MPFPKAEAYPGSTLFEYEPYGWQFYIPDGWGPMGEEVRTKLANRGKNIIEDPEHPNRKSAVENFILGQQHKIDKSLIMASEIERQEDELPYHVSRVKRFNFFKGIFSKRRMLKVSHETRGVYLGDLYFEGLFIRAETKSELIKMVSQQVVLETMRDGRQMAISIVSNDEDIYQKALDGLLASTFHSTEAPIPANWQIATVPGAQLYIPDGMKPSSKSTSTKKYWTNATEQGLLEVNQLSKADGPSMETPDAKDKARFFADFEFALSQALDRESPLKTQEVYVSGKRCFMGSYSYQRNGKSYTKQYIYIVGQRADFSIMLDGQLSLEDAERQIRQMAASLKEQAFKP